MKTRSSLSLLRDVICLTLYTSSAHAVVINPDATTGNLTATSVNNGANTIAAKGGTNPAPYTVTVDLGTVLTGDPSLQVGINITKAGYTITNNGSLSGDLFGIKSTNSAILYNTGIISGTTAGISTTADLFLDNSGTISGTDGIRFSGVNTHDTLHHTAGSITNTIGTAGNAVLFGSGDDTFLISGTAAITGIVNMGTGNDSATILGGTITGNLILGDGNDSITIDHATSITSIIGGNGLDSYTLNAALTGNIDAQADADSITLNAGASVTGTVNSGLGDDAVTLNSGSIIGLLNLNEGNDTLIIRGTSSATSIVAGNGADTIHLSGSFTGDIDSQGDNDSITLDAGTTITGNLLSGIGNDTINITDSTVSGTLNLGDGADNLTLTGTNSITSVLTGLGQDTLTIDGTFTGAIDTSTDNDTLILASGSQINGSILLSGGNDTATLTNTTFINGLLNLGEGDDSAVLNGINTLKLTAGGGNDTITLNGSQVGDLDAGAGDDHITFADGAMLTGNLTGSGDTDILTLSGAATIHGNISAMEIMTKQGPSTATIVGNVTSESINLTGGSLFINGNINQGGLTAILTTSNNATHFGGISTTYGNWNADLVHNAGTFSPGISLADSPSTARSNIIGNLTLHSALFNGGSLLIHADPSTRAMDLVNLTGNLSITNSHLIISPLTQDAPLINGQTTILSVAGTTSGNFLTPTIVFESGHIDTGITAAHDVGEFTPITFSLTTVPSSSAPNNIALSVTHHYQALPGLTGFGTALASSMNALPNAPITDLKLADFLGSIDYGNAAHSATLINSYEPTEYLTVQKFSVSSSTLLHRIVENENDITRYAKNQNHCWGNVNANGGDSSSYRITAGLSGTSSFDNTTFGALVSQMNMDNLTGINGDITTTTCGAYIGAGNFVGWQWNAFAGYLMSDAHINGLTNSYSPEGNGFQLLTSGAYTFEYDRITWGPSFGIEHVSIIPEDATLTTHTSGQPTLQVGADTLNSTRLLLGFKAEFDLPGRTTPYLSIQYAKELQGDWNNYHGSMRGSSFDVHAPNSLEDSLILLIGISHTFNDTWQAHAGYLGQLSTSSDHTDVHGLNLGIQTNF